MSDILLPQTITVTRRGSVTYPQTGPLRGQPVASPTTTFEISASVQPLNGSERYNAPEGKRSLASIKLYAQGQPELRVEEVEGTQQADVVTYRGRDYVIFNRDYYDDPSSTVPHVKYTAFASDVARPIPVEVGA